MSVSPKAAKKPSKLISSEKSFHFCKPSVNRPFLLCLPFDHTTLLFSMWQLISFPPDFYIKILENPLKLPHCSLSWYMQICIPIIMFFPPHSFLPSPFHVSSIVSCLNRTTWSFCAHWVPTQRATSCPVPDIITHHPQFCSSNYQQKCPGYFSFGKHWFYAPIHALHWYKNEWCRCQAEKCVPEILHYFSRLSFAHIRSYLI